jgi:hypothetical protein
VKSGATLPTAGGVLAGADIAAVLEAIAGELMAGAGVIIGADDPIAGAGVIIGADVPMAGAGVAIPPMAGVAIGAVVPMSGEVIAGLVCACDVNHPAKSEAETDKARIGNEGSFFMIEICVIS